MLSHEHQPPNFGQSFITVGISFKVKVRGVYDEVRRRGRATLRIIHLHGLNTVHLDQGGREGGWEGGKIEEGEYIKQGSSLQIQAGNYAV